MKVSLLGVKLSSGSFRSLLEEASTLMGKSQQGYIVTPNPEFVVYAQTDRYFKEILNKASLAIPDGIGLICASRVLNLPLRDRVAGADFGEALIKEAADSKKSVFFLGGRGDVAARTAFRMTSKYPGLMVAGSFSGEAGEEGDEETLLSIGQKPIGLLLVAYGHPKQEYWIDRNLGKIKVGVAMGVGGAFDFWSGDVKRAPTWVRSLGAEWLFRLIRQPWRLRRQSSLLKFIYLVFKEKWRK